MNTEESIGYIEGRLCGTTERSDIVRKLKEGDKYKKIVKEMDQVLEPGMIFEIPEGMVGSRHIDVVRYKFNQIKEKYFPKINEQVLILSIKGEKLVVDEITECIKQNYKNSNYVDVKEGTRGERRNKC